MWSPAIPLSALRLSTNHRHASREVRVVEVSMIRRDDGAVDTVRERLVWRHRFQLQYPFMHPRERKGRCS